MARQLHAQGQEIGLVALFDTFPTNYRAKTSVVTKFLLLPSRLKLFYLLRKAKNLRRNLSRRISKMCLPPALKEVRLACREAARHYEAKTYEGRVVLFRASDKSLKNFDDLLVGWNELALGGLEVQEVVGDHLSIIVEPQVSDLAKRLTECLQKTKWAQTYAPQNSMPTRLGSMDVLLQSSSQA
jgi:thioesterase domain-containing protein